MDDLPHFNECVGTSRYSHIKCYITCEKNISDNCVKTCVRTYKDIMNTKDRNDGIYMCLQCSRQLKNSGRDNPNVQYKNIDDNYFEHIDSDDKAYFLGWIASDGSITKSGFSIGIHEKDIDCLSKLRDLICHDTPIRKKQDSNVVFFLISSCKIAQDLCKWLSIPYGGESYKKSDIVKFPPIKEEYQIDFIRGYFDGDGSVSTVNRPNGKTPRLRAGIVSNSKSMLDSIRGIMNIPCYQGPTCLEWDYRKGMDFLDRIYKDSHLRLARKYNRYVEWVERRFEFFQIPCIRVAKNSLNAIIPNKVHQSDSGYDITLISLAKKLGPNLYLYGTGLRIAPDEGYYVELVARSSLMKYGYILANSVGIIDNQYRGELFVALWKLDLSMPDIELPFRGAQIIPRQFIRPEIVLVSNDNLDDTDRGNGGFGSTG